MSPSGRTCSYFCDQAHAHTEVLLPTQKEGHAAIAAIDSMPQASDGRRALADHAADVQFCADHFLDR
jgi:hypothetical protein